MGIAWILNLDAEGELAADRAYAPNAAVARKTTEMAARLEGLVRAGDVVLAGEARADGLVGRAWCPTPSALARLRAAGAREPRAPSLEVLRRANHRRLSAELGQGLPRAAYVTSEDELRRVLARALDRAETWLLKRPFGFAGRARRKVFPALYGGDGDFVTATLRAWGGLEAEPFVERRGDFALHGFLREGGEVTLGEPTVQLCDEQGAWERTVRAGDDDLTNLERSALVGAAEEAARALEAIGYFGPFGIDAYRYVDPESGQASFNPRCEINARYSMGWAVGMGALRPDRDEL